MQHVLLLEPNTLLTATYTAIFEHEGFTVSVAAGAQAGIHAADAQRPDVIVLELQLPRHNGVEFLHELRSYPEWQNIPVIVHTSLPPAKTEPSREVLQTSLGVAAVLYKHATSLADLVRAVRAQLVPA
jgi:DNA-binding response OmpR family regulator